MRRRLVALVLTLLVAATPETIAVCQAMCASAASHHDAVDHGHHSHDGPLIASHDDPCGQHGAPLSPLAARPSGPTTTVAIVTTAVLLVPPVPLARVDASRARAHQSGSVPLLTPLRI